MKKIVTKFWGIAIVVVMLASMCFVGAPVSAVTPVDWNYDATFPSYTPNSNWTQYPGTDIVDFAISSDGMTIYAALHLSNGTNDVILMKSTNGGASWTDLTSATNNRIPVTLDSVDFVAISPDNPDIVCVLDAGGTDTTIAAAASTDGGLTFYDMGNIQDSANNVITTAFDLDVSPQYQNGIYYVAVAGDGTAGDSNDPTLYYYNFGAAVGTWRDAVNDFGTPAVTPVGVTPTLAAATDNIKAVKFSPNFASDGCLMALSEQIGDGAANDGVLRLHVVSLSSHRWDTDLAITNYPVAVDTAPIADGPSTVNAAAIGLGPDFIGIEEESLVSFIGAAITDTANGQVGGLYRVDESASVKEIRSNVGMYSCAYDGNTVVAGSYADNNVYRVTDPLAGSPSASSARSLKRIGVDDAGNDMVVVHWAGETVFGTKMGAASAISKSTDLGNTWNDYSLMDSANTNVNDVWVTADGSVKYLSSDDNTEASIYRVVGRSVQRVLCVSGAALAFKLRGLPDDPDVIYAFDMTTRDIYQTADGGVDRWSRKTTYPGTTLNDVAVESATTIYGVSGALIYKSTNNGSGWSTGVDTLVSGGIFSLTSLGEGQLLAGGIGNGVGWSTDGGATWTRNGPPVPGSNFYMAATGLTSDDYIFVAAAEGAEVYRAHPAPAGTEFKAMNLGDIAAGVTGWSGTGTTQGMALTNGVLYVLGAELAGTGGVYLSHTMAPTIPTHTMAIWGTQNVDTGITSPIATGVADLSILRAASGSINLYTPINTAGPGPGGVFYFNDIVSSPADAPKLRGPADGAQFEILSTMLADSELVTFTWDRVAPQVTAYNLYVALDSSFTEPVPLLGTNGVTSYPTFIGSGAPSDIVSYVSTRTSFSPGKTYYWKVAPRTPINGAQSEVRSFTIAPSAATVPQLMTPENGTSTTSVSPAFSWSAITGTTLYDIEVSDMPGFETTIYTDQVVSAGAALPVTIELEEGKTYFWRVRAAEPVLGDWSTAGNFMVVAEVTSTPPVTVTQPPAITITMPTPAAPTTITVVPPEEPAQIAPAYIWAIIIIGAILVIAVIVLIVRTRRSV